MLTLDLLRFRVHGEYVTPIYLTVRGGRKYLNLAECILTIFQSSVGRSVGELEQSLEEAIGGSLDFKVCRGLAKIAREHMVTTPPADIEAEQFRKTVFTLAAQLGPPARKTDLIFTKGTSKKLTSIAEKIGKSPEEITSLLYADLKENQIISSFDPELDAVGLIERYNTALAQAMLFRATKMAIDIYDSYSLVFKYIKLTRLMHTIKHYKEGYRIILDGPMSLLANVERYGVAMATLLPAVLKCRRWKLLAKINVGSEEKLFQLDPSAGLTSHYPNKPQFDSLAEEAFYIKFARKQDRKWRIEREGAILDLKETVLIPDFRFIHEDGRIAYLEIVGFWTPEYLQRKLDKLARAQEQNIVIAVPDALNCSREDFTGPVVRYKRRLLIKDVLPAIEQAARLPQEIPATVDS